MGEEQSHFVEFTGGDVKMLISNVGPESRKKRQQNFWLSTRVRKLMEG